MTDRQPTAKQLLVAHLEAHHRRLPRNRNFKDLSRRHGQEHWRLDAALGHYHDPTRRSNPSSPPGAGNRPLGWTTGQDVIVRERRGLVPPRSAPAPETEAPTFELKRPGNLHRIDSYQAHMVTVAPGEASNYRVSCTCSWYTNLASRSDVRAAECALEHVREAQPAAVLRRAGLLEEV